MKEKRPINNFGVFSSISRIPIKAAYSFLNEVNDLITSKRLSFSQHGEDNNDPTSSFILFGHNDILILEELNNLEIAQRFLKKFTFDRNRYNLSINEGKFIFYNNFCQIVGEDDPIQKFSNFKLNIRRYPLICYIQIKWDSILFSNYNKQLEKGVYEHLKDFEEDSIEILALDSFNWNESIFICCSNSYEKIYRILERLNNIKLSTIKDKLEVDNIYKFLESCSIITRTTTNLGFSSELFYKPKQFFNSIDKNEILFPMLKGKIKSNNLNTLINSYGKVEFNYSVGEDDFYILNSFVSRKGIKAELFFRYIHREFKSKRNFAVGIKPETIFINPRIKRVKDLGQQASFQKRIRNLNTLLSKSQLINNSSIESFYQTLKMLKVPTTLRDSIVDLLYDYNDCILENGYSYSLNILKSIVDNFIADCEDHKDQIFTNEKHFQSSYNSVLPQVQNFIISFRNSLNLKKKKENIFYDYHDRQFSFFLIAEFSYSSFSSVLMGIQAYLYSDFHDNITVSDFGLRINNYHLSQPEKLFSIIFSEVCMNIYKDEFFVNNFPCLRQLYNTEDTPKEILLILKQELKSKRNIFTRKKRKKYDSFFSNIQNDIFEHIISDSLNLSVLFEGNFEKYSFWYWSNVNMFQTYYNYNDTISQSCFERYYLRYAFLEEILDKKPIDLDIFSKDQGFLQRDFKDKAKEFVKQIFKCSNFKDFSKELKLLEKNIVFKVESNRTTKSITILVRTLLNEIQALYKNGDGYSFSFSGNIIPKNTEVQIYLTSARLNFYKAVRILLYQKSGDLIKFHFEKLIN